MAERKTGSSGSRRSSGASRGRKASGSKAPTGNASASKAKPAASKARTSSSSRSRKKPPAPNMNERMEGLQGWMAEIERKQERMTRIGGIALVVAIAAAAAAIALGVLGQQSAASDDDLDKLRDDVNALSGEVERQTEKQLGGLNQKLTTLEGKVTSLEQQQRQNAATIANLESRSNRRGGGAGAALPAVPGARP